MAKKTVALSVEENIYNKYREYCVNQGIILSKQVEKFMEKELVSNSQKE